MSDLANAIRKFLLSDCMKIYAGRPLRRYEWFEDETGTLHLREKPIPERDWSKAWWNSE